MSTQKMAASFRSRRISIEKPVRSMRSSFSGIEINVLGNQQVYGAHLRSVDLSRPQQSYRQVFVATSVWQTLRLPLAQFVAHHTGTPLNTARLSRIGLVAIGREFTADLSVARLTLY